MAATDLPLLLTLAVAITGACLLLLNIGLVACFVYRKKRRSGLESSGDFQFISLGKFQFEIFVYILFWILCPEKQEMFNKYQ